jgi:beta-lactamase regulating signal transducer with metallopeptidase domain
MNAIIQLLNDFSGPWAAWIWRATWQAAIVVAVAWLLTVALARQSPRFRSWIWRLAYLKLLVLLVWTTPLRLAVLPAEAGSQESGVRSQESSVRAASDTAPISTDMKDQIAGVAPRSADEPEISNLAIAPPLSDSRLPIPDFRFRDLGPPLVSRQPATSIAWQSWLFSAWLIGLAAVVAWLAWGVLRAMKLWRSARAINRSDLDRILQDVRRDLKLRSHAQLTESNLAAGPMLVKFLVPRIIFPAEMIDQLSPEEIRLVLAHELAHIKRRDLAWNALAAVVHIALYFHPLVWLAHRLSRREQELACDELVVTRLAVERHDYGQMLLKVVRRARNVAGSGVAVVGMSTSYKTLSRRLDAMKTIRSFTHRQVVAAACALCLVATLAIVPWRLVAQEKQGAHTDRDQTKAADGSSESGGAPTDEAAMKKLIVGAWRGPRKNELEFFRDGTVEEFPSELLPPKGEVASTKAKFLGKWYVDTSQMQLLGPLLTIQPSGGTASLRGLPEIPRGDDTPLAVNFTIDRLDDSFLRLTQFGGSGTAFYRRIDAHAPAKEFDASVPANLRNVMHLAGLTPEEALALSKWLGPNREGDTQLIRFAALEKLDQARHGTIDFAELLGLDKDEAAAFRDLYKMTRGEINWAARLAEIDQLTPVEVRAVKKVQAFLKQARDNDQRAYDWYHNFLSSNALIGQGPGRETQSRVGETYDPGLAPPLSDSRALGRGGRGPPSVHRNAVESLTPADRLTLEAVQKLAEFAREEDDFLDKTVFGNR